MRDVDSQKPQSSIQQTHQQEPLELAWSWASPVLFDRSEQQWCPCGPTSPSSSSLSSSSKGFSLWKMQHFLELFLWRNSLSTVPSFHETFFFLRLSFRTRVSCACWEGEEKGAWEGRSRVKVVVADAYVDEDEDLLVAVIIGRDMIGSGKIGPRIWRICGLSGSEKRRIEWVWFLKAPCRDGERNGHE